MYPRAVEKIVSIKQESISLHAICEQRAIAINEIALNIPAKVTKGNGILNKDNSITNADDCLG